ncbi:unnamed protein product [Moneuplotes crassus]|uniref:Uncharacterized protein n=1 Tax=Euplotes crassus TaxID=5936 RepID=A0AAD1UMC5_EUPCR|nr:unnamed protein product [Moneuplotes crassus]
MNTLFQKDEANLKGLLDKPQVIGNKVIRKMGYQTKRSMESRQRYLTSINPYNKTQSKTASLVQNLDQKPMKGAKALCSASRHPKQAKKKTKKSIIIPKNIVIPSKMT